MKTVPVPGGSADLREQNEIKVRHRRLVESASVGAATALAKLPSDQAELEAATLAELDLTEAEADNLFRLQDATIVAALDSWTLPGPTPTLATVGDLDPEVYDALAEATRELGTAIAGAEDFEPSNPASPEFQASPTPRSAGSEEHSKGAQEPASTETLPTSTKSSDFEGPFTD